MAEYLSSVCKVLILIPGFNTLKTEANRGTLPNPVEDETERQCGSTALVNQALKHKLASLIYSVPKKQTTRLSSSAEEMITHKDITTKKSNNGAIAAHLQWGEIEQPSS